MESQLIVDSCFQCNCRCDKSVVGIVLSIVDIACAAFAASVDIVNPCRLVVVVVENFELVENFLRVELDTPAWCDASGMGCD